MPIDRFIFMKHRKKAIKMIRVKFKNKPIYYDVNFEITTDKVRLTGDKLKKNTSGFSAYRLNGDLLGDYSDFTKCTQEAPDIFVFERP